MLETTSPSGSSSDQSKSSLAGRMIISVPMKPPITSAQRSIDTRSRSISDASSVMTSGVTITMAVNSPTGIARRPKKARQLLVISSAARSN